MLIKQYKIYSGIKQDELTLENHRYSVVRDSTIKTLRLINCQDCLVMGNTVETLNVDSKVPEFENKRFFRKIRKKRFLNKFGSQHNIIMFNIALGDKFKC
ncbi:hypothetical protein LCGC14_1698610 [marine sediment metagenome]|uniref:Uncharacterized protein n=1 Tax=marine sediment metagenome TaxID=412755 RepID=A0A0F9HIG7_9ZZZZ